MKYVAGLEARVLGHSVVSVEVKKDLMVSLVRKAKPSAVIGIAQ